MLFLLFFCKKGRKKGYGELCQLTQNVTWQPSITSAIAAASMLAMPIEKRVEVASTAMLCLLCHVVAGLAMLWQGRHCMARCVLLWLAATYNGMFHAICCVVCCSLMLFLYQPRTYLASEYLPMSEASFTGSNWREYGLRFEVSIGLPLISTLLNSHRWADSRIGFS